MSHLKLNYPVGSYKNTCTGMGDGTIVRHMVDIGTLNFDRLW